MAEPKREIPRQNFGLGFSRTEASQVAIGVAVMTLAFALAYIGGARHLLDYFQAGGPSLVLLIITGSFVAVSTAFFSHELAHKAVAQRYGAVAEYRFFPAGLVAGLGTAAAGWMVAFPGNTEVSGKVTPKQHLRISAAGPATNLVCATVFIGLSVLLGTTPGRFRDAIAVIIGAIAFVNVMLAGFNLIPLPTIGVKVKIARRVPMVFAFPASDGLVILKASKAAWAAAVAALFAVGLWGHALGVF
jgi:Zn-dependent protease